MSHEVETMAFANEVPWHGLGERVDDCVSVDDMLVKSGLNWKVVQRPLFAKMEDGTTVNVPDRFALIRDKDNRVLTVTGKVWKPMQNEDALGFMRDYVEAGAATLETAGSLRMGKVVWGLANLKHSFTVAGRSDAVKGYLLITVPHDVGKAITIHLTAIRVVCANTMRIAHETTSRTYSQNHLTEFNRDAAKAAIGAAHEQLAVAEKRYKTLQKLKISVEDAVRKAIVPVIHPKLVTDDDAMRDIMNEDKQPKTLREIIDSINNAPGKIIGTGWGALNGVTHWADHVAGREANARMWRAFTGDTAQMKLDVEAKLLELV